MHKDKPVPPGYKEIFRPFFTTKTGQRVYAWQRGLRAFRFVVPV